MFIPPGASPTATEPTVREVDPSAYPDEERLVSGVFEIGPSGSQFDVPVTVGIPIDPDTPAGTPVEVIRFDEESGAWETMPGTTIVENLAMAPTEHFTPFAVAVSPQPPGCDNIWGGGPGMVARMLVPETIEVSPAVKLDEQFANSAFAQIALGSTWTTDACEVTVSGQFGDGLQGNGAWVDWQTGSGGEIPQGPGGSFSFTLPTGPGNGGPYYGLTDPCHAPLQNYIYNLTIEATSDCPDLCEGVTCDDDDGNPCTADTCDPATGSCEQSPSDGSCGSSGAGLCVAGSCMLEVIMDGSTDGRAACEAEGLTCVDNPVLAPPEAACLAFHPDASVSSDANGWKQGVYCDDNMGAACAGRANDCHHCPACNDTGITCSQLGSDLIESIFVRCG